ncbi:DUF411 domain-containing protein [Microbulbifer sp. VTAC004]|uniref:DUF411 domain-containing protein n=1 Tax=unclassified Microbulbifer TaxID=2619833 RepID=UPI004039462F
MPRPFNVLVKVFSLFVVTALFVSAAIAEQDDDKIIVYKHPLCFCCKKWVSHLRENQLQASSVFKVDMQAVKKQWGVPKGMEGCHTAVWQGRYVFEGHVPAQFIQKFLTSPPKDSVGLMVPGMPIGSPGMEAKDKFEPYNIYLLLQDGDYRLYARIEDPRAIQLMDSKPAE